MSFILLSSSIPLSFFASFLICFFVLFFIVFRVFCFSLSLHDSISNFSLKFCSFRFFIIRFSVFGFNFFVVPNIFFAVSFSVSVRLGQSICLFSILSSSVSFFVISSWNLAFSLSFLKFSRFIFGMTFLFPLYTMYGFSSFTLHMTRL